MNEAIETETPQAPDSEILNTTTTRINEITVVHVAGPGLTLDRLRHTPAAEGITGVDLNGTPLDLQGGKIVHVNITFDGVSFDCDASMLQVLEDVAVRQKMVDGAKQAYADYLAEQEEERQKRAQLGLADHQDGTGAVAIPDVAGESPA